MVTTSRQKAMDMMEQKVEWFLAEVENDKCHDLLVGIVSAAMEYFVECHDDFCVQNFDGQSVIFGGTNRLVWSASHGFRPDRSYCTEKFLMRCASLGDLPRR